MARINLTREVTVNVDSAAADESVVSIVVDDPNDTSFRRQSHEISGTPQALYALAMGLLAGLDPNHHRVRGARPLPRGRAQRPVPEPAEAAAAESPPE